MNLSENFFENVWSAPSHFSAHTFLGTASSNLFPSSGVRDDLFVAGGIAEKGNLFTSGSAVFGEVGIRALPSIQTRAIATEIVSERASDFLPEPLAGSSAAGGPTATHIEDVLLVKFVPAATPSAILDTSLAVGSTSFESLVPSDGAIDTPLERWFVLAFAPGSDLQQAQADLQASAWVEETSLNYTLAPQARTPLPPFDPQFSSQWHLHNTGQTGGTPGADIDALTGWVFQKGSHDVKVAVIDTGIDYNHEDLAANIWVNPGEIEGNGMDDDGNGYVDDFRGWDFGDSDNDVSDDSLFVGGHGTQVAGVLGAVGNNDIGIAGVSQRVGIVPIKSYNSAGFQSIEMAAQAIRYAVDIGADIINASWGGPVLSSFAVLEDAIAYANDADVLLVAAAGNNGADSSSFFLPFFPAAFDAPNIISVAATTHTDDLWFDSNYGAIEVDLGAPGENILSTLPGNAYGSSSGTSLAAPQVAGAAALLLARDPSLSVAEIKQILLDTTDSLPALQGKTVSGGRLNIARALLSTYS